MVTTTTTTTWLHPQPYGNNHKRIVTTPTTWLHNHDHMVTQPQGYNHNCMVTTTTAWLHPHGYNHNRVATTTTTAWCKAWCNDECCVYGLEIRTKRQVEVLTAADLLRTSSMALHHIQVSYSKIQVWEDWEDELCCPILYSLNFNFQR